MEELLIKSNGQWELTDLQKANSTPMFQDGSTLHFTRAVSENAGGSRGYDIQEHTKNGEIKEHKGVGLGPLKTRVDAGGHKTLPRKTGTTIKDYNHHDGPFTVKHTPVRDYSSSGASRKYMRESIHPVLDEETKE